MNETKINKTDKPVARLNKEKTQVTHNQNKAGTAL